MNKPTVQPARAKPRAFNPKAPAAATVKVKSLRLEPAYEAGLGLLKAVLKKPLNKMVNEAVGEYIDRRTAEAEAHLTGTLERLKAYRRGDPAFEQDLAGFVAAEARHGKRDPMEGVTYSVVPPKAATAAAKKSRPTKAGPALKKVRDLIRG
jgi:hypothetical protein